MYETENVRSNRTKFFKWHKFLWKEFLRNFFGKKCKNGKNLWFFECHVFRVGDTIFFMKHKTWSLSRERFLVFMNFLYKIFLYHYFARNEIKIKLWFLGKRYGFSGIWGDQVHQWTIRIFLDDRTKAHILTTSWPKIFKFQILLPPNEGRIGQTHQFQTSFWGSWFLILISQIFPLNTTNTKTDSYSRWVSSRTIYYFNFKLFQLKMKISSKK